MLPQTLLLALLACTSFAYTPHKRSYDSHNYYVFEHNPSAGTSLADISSLLGLEVIEKVGELQNHYLARILKPELESRQSKDILVERWKSLRRDTLSVRSESSLHAREVASSVRYLAPQIPKQRIKRAPPPIVPEEPTEVVSASRDIAQRLGIQDPLFPTQWHLVNEENPEHMMNVTGLWELGITGKGIISSLVDDGLDYTSVDLKDNFDADDSYDFNDHEDLPFPKLFDDHHGTRCAGQVAAGKNAACGVGIAYNSRVAGVRILSGPISDVDEAAALNYGYQNVSIYSCSWGPPDNGQAMEGPSQLIKQAVLNGINKGRGGKGSIFVFASGNGASHGDQCNFDGYTNSIYSVTVSAVDYKGLHPYYSEPCAANMIVAYSSGSGKHIVTTDKGEDACSSSHGGTSAAAPNAVGVFALALEARPELTWRDIQYLCVQTARLINPDDEWETTAAGRPYSYKYGFGALDGYSFVRAAMDWELVKPQTWIQSRTSVLGDGTMTEEGAFSGGVPIPEGGIENTIEITQAMLEANNFETLEHINVKVWIQHGKRGDVEVEVVSPNGIKSVLAQKRKVDTDDTGYPGWIFMSVKHWGESPVGNWKIRVSDMQDERYNGSFLGWNMLLWGSSLDPKQVKLYELPPDEAAFPPKELTSPASTTTPEDTPLSTAPPTIQEGEVAATNANEPTSTPIASPTSTPTADEGWFPDMSNLVSNKKWFFGAIAAVAIFCLSVAGFFFWRRRQTRKQNLEYATLPQNGEEMQMTSAPMGSRPRTKELYDAFGEVSDDEDEDDEQALLSSSHREAVSEGIGFHSGFLDDDDPATPGSSAGRYRDEPDNGRPAVS